MADISQITLPNGDVVNLKDSAGREAATNGLAEKVSIAQGAQNKGKILQVSNGGRLELVDADLGSGDVVGPSSSVNGDVALFDGTTGKLIKDSGFTIGKSVPSDAVFTDTTYESKSAASGGTDESLVTTGEKYNWNSKTSNVGTVTGVKMNSGSSIEPDANGVVDLGTVITSHQDITGKADLVDGKVPSTQLPSYVDDVLEYASLESFPLTGEAGKIYIASDTNKTYRWSGSAYVEITESLALGETSSSAYRGDRGAAAYAASVTNVDSTPTENSTHLITSGGVWEAENEKIDKKYEISFGSNWSAKTWSGLTSFNGEYIWSDGDNIYYSNNNDQYVLDKSTSTWSTKIWNGLPNYGGFIAPAIWTDGENIYYSPGSNHYVLNKSTSTWSTKVWYGLTGFHGSNIWSDGDNIYNSSGSSQNILDKSTSTWSDKTWSGLTSFTGNNIWSEGDNIYYSSSSNQYILNKSTSTWSAKEWTGLTSFSGQYIWSDGDNIYYSDYSNHYILNKLTSTWSTKTWTGLTGFGGINVWTDGENIYFSNGTTQYALDKDNSSKLLLGTNGEFSPVAASEVLPSDMTGASSSADGTHGLVPAPSAGDEEKFLKGDGTWDDVDALPVVTSSDNEKVLEVNNGEWTIGNEKINRKYEISFGSNWSIKEWTGLNSFDGFYIWSDGDNIYYSYNTNQYVLNKSTSTWSAKSWTGLTSFYGYDIWSDGDNIYYSSSSNQYVLNKSTSTWSTKSWTGLTSFDGSNIWTDGDNIYWSRSSDQYVLDKATSTWSAKVWTGLTSFDGSNIWTDGDNIYWSRYYTVWVLNKTASEWTEKTFYGISDEILGKNIWTDGVNVYYSYGYTQYVLDKSTSTWSAKTWTGLTDFDGQYVWTDGENIYYSNSYSSDQYVLYEVKKLLLGSNGEFNPVSAEGIEVVQGKLVVGRDKLNKYLEEGLYQKTWNGLTSFNGDKIWSDGDDVYYSNSSNQYILNKSISTWSTKTWTGLTSFDGPKVWTDGENIYYSSGSSQKVLNKATSTWTNKGWSGLTNFAGEYVWTDGENIYYSNSSNQYVLDKSTSTWSAKTWTGLTSFDGRYVWTDGENIYYSNSSNQYVLDKATSTWTQKTWSGLTSLFGTYIWTDGENIYYSASAISAQYVLNKATSTWIQNEWSGLENLDGRYVWTDGENVYCSNSSNQYEIVSGTYIYATVNGEFNPVHVSDVVPSVINHLTSDSTTDALRAAQGKVLNSNLGSPSSASGVAGNDAFSKINALNSKIARMESTQFEDTVTINAYTSSSNPYTFPNDGYLMISAGSGTNSLYDVYVIASDSATAVLARLNKRFTEASQVDSLFVRKGTRAYVADRSSSVTVAFREFK